MTSGTDDLIRAFLADEARRAMAGAPSLEEAVGRLAPRIGGRPRGANQRLIVLLAATLLLVAALGAALAVGSGILRLPLVNDSPFQGTWVSTSDNDGGIQTMYVRVSAGGGVEITVHDNVAAACSGTRSAMTGTGRIEGGMQLVIPAPVYTCDNGSEPQAVSGPPLEEQLRNLTFVYDAESGLLTVGSGSVWRRPGAPDPSSMWPQTSLDEVQHAQERADAGDPAYIWQLDAEVANGNPANAEIVARFLREELGWEEFLFNGFVGWDQVDSNLYYVRCAPGATNPLYPDDAYAGKCAPTIDGLRYETVRVDLAQPVRSDPSGIWVVSRWATAAPFAQTDPAVVEAAATARLGDFLQARIGGEGAEGYVEVEDTVGEVPLMYGPTTGADYEQSEIERRSGPYWPYGWMEFTIRLFADGGATVVEQPVSLSDGGLYLAASATTENGQPLAVTYSFFEGAVTFAAAEPWNVRGGLDNWGALTMGEFWSSQEGIELVACDPGLADENAQALALGIQSDPDNAATVPVAVRMGGVEGLVMDVTIAAEMSVCGANFPSAEVVTRSTLGEGIRIRFFLLDVPEGPANRTLVIAIAAPEGRFDAVIEAAAPIIESVEFPRAVTALEGRAASSP